MTTNELIQANIGLIRSIANKFYQTDQEDLIQAGIIGLLEAYKHYKKSDAQFSTYAYKYIFGSMYSLVNATKDLKVSRSLLKIYKLAEKTRFLLSQEYGHIATNEEISIYLNIPLSELEMALNSAQRLIRLDDEAKEINLHEVIPDQNNPNLDLKLDLENSLSTLSPEEKAIIKSRYYEDLTQSEVAQKLNMTQVMVSRYEKRILAKMRTLMM